ncbi:MAG: zinc ribbon domain-containing protein [Lachnospiraceae bacterium]|nr:zinc ribbon domain-containing protein [Lachnospiraceae bacterium]
MFCPNCGGEYADWALKCPYCGSVNDAGAEKAYMAHMEELKKRLDRVDDEAEGMYRKAMSTGMRRVVMAVVIAVAAALLIFAVVRIVERIGISNEERRYQEQLAWEAEEYPKLDAMYAEGNFAGILEECDRVMMEEPLYDVYDWPHYTFVDDYFSHYVDLHAAEMAIAEKDIDEYELGMGIYAALYLGYDTTDEVLERLRKSYDMNRSFGISEEDEVMIRAFGEDARRFLTETLGWSEAESEAFYKSCLEDGYLSSSRCFDKAEELIAAGQWS